MNDRAMQVPDDLFEPYATQPQAVSAAGASNAAVNNWVERGLVTPAGGRPGRAGRRLYSFFDILKTAVMTRLAAAGVPPSLSCELVDARRQQIAASGGALFFVGIDRGDSGPEWAVYDEPGVLLPLIAPPAYWSEPKPPAARVVVIVNVAEIARDVRAKLEGMK